MTWYPVKLWQMNDVLNDREDTCKCERRRWRWQRRRRWWWWSMKKRKKKIKHNHDTHRYTYTITTTLIKSAPIEPNNVKTNEDKYDYDCSFGVHKKSNSHLSQSTIPWAIENNFSNYIVYSANRFEFVACCHLHCV